MPPFESNNGDYGGERSERGVRDQVDIGDEWSVAERECMRRKGCDWRVWDERDVWLRLMRGWRARSMIQES